DRMDDIFVRDPAAAVDIGDQPDPQARERCREIDHGHRDARDLELVSFVRVAVRAGPRDGSDAGREERFQDGAPTDRHRRYSNRIVNLYEELSWRGMVYDATDGVPHLLATEHATAYIGFDPTAAS